MNVAAVFRFLHHVLDQRAYTLIVHLNGYHI